MATSKKRKLNLVWCLRRALLLLSCRFVRAMKQLNVVLSHSIRQRPRSRRCAMINIRFTMLLLLHVPRCRLPSICAPVSMVFHLRQRRPRDCRSLALVRTNPLTRSAFCFPLILVDFLCFQSMSSPDPCSSSHSSELDVRRCGLSVS